MNADYIILANNDIRVDPRWISVAVNVAESDPRIGILGYRILEPKGIHRDAGFEEAMAIWSGLSVREAAAVNGMAMFVRASVFRNFGLIDEGFLPMPKIMILSGGLARADTGWFPRTFPSGIMREGRSEKHPFAPASCKSATT